MKLTFFTLLSLLPLVPADEQIPIRSSLTPVDDIPPLGFGTWNLSNASDVVSVALKIGYRHIDAAAAYSNQKSVGEGIRKGLSAAEITREDIWVTSKLWNNMHSPQDVPRALDGTLEQLGLEYLDLYLMHWPVKQGKGGKNMIDFIDTWKAMTKLPKSKVRHIGICNFSPAQLAALLASTPGITPYVHQFELHPYLPQDAFVASHIPFGIKVTAYSPLGNTNPIYDSKAAVAVPPLLKNDIIIGVAAARACTPAQVALAWGIKRGTSVIPKSAHEDRLKENFEVLEKCELTDDDIKRLGNELPIKRFNNPSKSWGVKLYQGLEDSGTEVKSIASMLWDLVCSVSAVIYEKAKEVLMGVAIAEL